MVLSPYIIKYNWLQLMNKESYNTIIMKNLICIYIYKLVNQLASYHASQLAS
jgi:hypothetical protein